MSAKENAYFLAIWKIGVVEYAETNITDFLFGAVLPFPAETWPTCYSSWNNTVNSEQMDSKFENTNTLEHPLLQL